MNVDWQQPGGAIDAFVQQAVREKLAADERRKRFHQLSAEMREAMLAQGLTEEETLADFEEQRRKTIDNLCDEFDTLCNKAIVSSPRTHLMRDQLHERD